MKFRPGDRVTVQPPYDSPHMQCSPHAVVDRETDGGYLVTVPTMVTADGGLMRFGPYPASKLTAGWDDRLNRL